MYLIHLWYSSCSNELRKEHHFSLGWSETHTELDNCRNLSSFGLTLFIKGELTCQWLIASTKQKGALGAPSPSCFRLLLFTWSLNPCSALNSQIRCRKRPFDCQSSIPLRNKQSFTLAFTQIHSGWPHCIRNQSWSLGPYLLQFLTSGKDLLTSLPIPLRSCNSCFLCLNPKQCCNYAVRIPWILMRRKGRE